MFWSMVEHESEELINFFKKSNSYFVFIVLTTLLSKPEVCLLLFRLNRSECMVWSFSIHGRKVRHKTNDSRTVSYCILKLLQTFSFLYLKFTGRSSRSQ